MASNPAKQLAWMFCFTQSNNFFFLYIFFLSNNLINKGHERALKLTYEDILHGIAPPIINS